MAVAQARLWLASFLKCLVLSFRSHDAGRSPLMYHGAVENTSSGRQERGQHGHGAEGEPTRQRPERDHHVEGWPQGDTPACYGRAALPLGDRRCRCNTPTTLALSALGQVGGYKTTAPAPKPDPVKPSRAEGPTRPAAAAQRG